MHSMRPEDIIDLDAYPISDADGAARTDLTTRVRNQLAAQQYCSLPGFVRPHALESIVGEARAAHPHAYHNNSRRNCYLQRTGDPALGETHPRNILLDASTRMIAYDLLPEESPLKTLYHWDCMRRMVAEIVGVDALYANEDPYQPANILCYEPGDRSAWHFDSVNAFTMTLMLQAPDSGGDFEIVPNTRSDDDQNYDYVREVLAGKRQQDTVQVARDPGALCIFRGCNSMHRVAPVTGQTMRLMAVFVYETERGIVGDPEVNATVYGPRAVVVD